MNPIYLTKPTANPNGNSLIKNIMDFNGKVWLSGTKGILKRALLENWLEKFSLGVLWATKL